MMFQIGILDNFVSEAIFYSKINLPFGASELYMVLVYMVLDSGMVTPFSSTMCSWSERATCIIKRMVEEGLVVQSFTSVRNIFNI